MAEEGEGSVMSSRLPAMLAVAAACAFASSQSRGLSWEEWPSLSEGVAGGAIGHIGNSIVYAGGTTWRNGEKHYLSDVRQYSPESKKWTEGPALPETLAYGAYLQGDSFLEVYGGSGQNAVSRSCWRLESGEREWKHCGILPTSTLFAGAASIGTNVYLFGGCSKLTDLSTCTPSVLRRDEHGQWAHVTDLPGGAIALSAVTELNGRAYLFGGCIASGSGTAENQRSAYRYDPAANSWIRLRDLPVAVRSASAVSLGGNRILIAGGYGETGAAQDVVPGFVREVWIYSTDSDTYERGAPLPFGVSGIALARYGAGIVAVGGEDRMRGRSPRVLHGHFTD